MSVNSYKKQSLKAGWTRVDLLLEIYDRAITAVQGCSNAAAVGDEATYAQQLIAAEKAILAIHSGLQPEENEVAFSVARLLHFAATSIEKQDYDAALKILGDLRSGFAAVADEVNELERKGAIPSIPEDDTYVY